MDFWEWLRILFISIVEGITEWLPISSTGHMILVDEVWKTSATTVLTPEFWRVFLVLVQLGAIMAVITVFFRRLNPISKKKNQEERKRTIELWVKIVIGCLPAGIAGILLDDWLDAHLYNGYVVAAMLILYGILFVFLESKNKHRKFQVQKFSQMTYQMALLIGVIQILSLIPGTSRSGVTILGAMLLGCSRYIAAEYAFFLAIPIMTGASLLKFFKYLLSGNGFSGTQLLIVLVGMLTAYIVSFFVIRFLLQYVKKKDFSAFGFYRIILGLVVMVFFLIS